MSIFFVEGIQMAARRVVVAFGLLLAATLGSARGDESPAPVQEVDFSRDVQPILAEHCLRCHGPDKAEARLNLADRQAAIRELESGNRAIVPGRADQGELLRRVTSRDDDERMPPEGKPLKPDQIDVLRRWIAAGAEYQVHWSFRPLVKPQPPKVADAAWVRNPIDAFVHAKLKDHMIEPSPEADRYTLVKRAYLDLVGLLPKPEEADAFVADSSADAYERLINRLLASPHFGERWGRHWLDMARYADSDGYEKDRARPDAYVYRDWVINALNRDLPFDRFTIDQLAGDLLPDAASSDKIATAFNRQTLTNVEGGVDQEEYRVAAVFDRTDTLGSVWLGLTVGCARCHTHKYDPIKHQEYYRLFAFFNDADETVASVPVKAKNLDALAAKLRPLEAALETRYDELLPAEQRWEDENRRRIETTPTTPLRVEPIEIVTIQTQSGARFARQKDGSYLLEDVVTPKAKNAAAFDTDVYTVTLANVPTDLTGLRLEAIPDPSLPKQGPGRSANGNFVVTQLRVDVTDRQGKVVRSVPVQRASADFEQRGYKASDAISATVNKKKGWGVLPAVGKKHYLQVRTTEPLTLSDDQQLQVVIEQHYGAGHTLGRFRLQAVTGDARDLQLPEAVVQALKQYPEKRVYETRQQLFSFFMSQDPQVRQLQAKINAANAEFQAQSMPVRMISVARATPDAPLRTRRLPDAGRRIAARHARRVAATREDGRPADAFGAGPLACWTGQSAHAACRGQPGLGPLVRSRHCPLGWRFWRAWRNAFTSRTARLAGRHVPRRTALEPEVAVAQRYDFGHVPPVVRASARINRRRSAQHAPLSSEPVASRRGNRPRPGARDRRVAVAEDRRTERLPADACGSGEIELCQ